MKKESNIELFKLSGKIGVIIFLTPVIIGIFLIFFFGVVENDCISYISGNDNVNCFSSLLLGILIAAIFCPIIYFIVGYITLGANKIKIINKLLSNKNKYLKGSIVGVITSIILYVLNFLFLRMYYSLIDPNSRNLIFLFFPFFWSTIVNIIPSIFLFDRFNDIQSYLIFYNILSFISHIIFGIIVGLITALIIDKIKIIKMKK